MRNIYVVLMNYPHLRVAYGDDSALRVVNALRNRFSVEGKMVFVVDSSSFVVQMDEDTPESMMDIYVSLSVSPVLVEDGIWILPVISIASVDHVVIDSCALSSMVCRDECIGAPLKAAKLNHKWRAAYVRDMGVCVELMSRLEKQQASLRRQSVRNMISRAVLYEEAFLKFEGRGGQTPMGFADCADAIKNVGIQKVIDMHVLSAVLVHLERESTATIGCNLSASSFIVDSLWSHMIASLESNPDIARRLVIELTEEESIDDFETVLLFIKKLKALGCKFALDDLGAGMSRTSVLEDAGFEYIKIDKSLLHGARNDALGKRLLQSTIEYCAFFSKDIIVEGVETGDDLKEVLRLGVAGGQGYYFCGDSVKLDIPVVNIMRRQAAVY